MPRKKLQRFKEFREFPNSFEFEEKLKGEWGSEFFKNTNPIVLELACGKGDYALGLAEIFPNKNYIGVDIQGERLWRGAKTAIESDLKNVAFLRTYIDKIDDHFENDEISEIWITFPDPHPQKCKANKRLTSPRFLSLYRKILKKSGLINLKTDHEGLFEYTLEVLKEKKIKPEEVMRDIYKVEVEDEKLKIQTFYEKKHLAAGKKIYYLNFKLK